MGFVSFGFFAKGLGVLRSLVALARPRASSVVGVSFQEGRFGLLLNCLHYPRFGS